MGEKAQKETALLEVEAQELDSRIEAGETFIHNIEHTLKVMEETKTIFLEEVAVERPALIQELIRTEEAERDHEDDDGGGGHDAEHDEKDQLARLAAEEVEMRAELKKAQLTLDSLVSPTSKDKDG